MQSTRRAALALALVCSLPCAVAHAEVAASVSPLDPADGPLGIAACTTELTWVFTGQRLHEDGTPLIVDVWWSTNPELDCGAPLLRANGTCTHVSFSDGTMVSDSHGVTLTTTAAELFADLANACDGSNVARTFFFFDAQIASDVSTTFVTENRATRTITLDTLAPTPPMLDGDAIGDSAITLGWIAGASDPSPSSVRFYVDTAGCPRTGVPTSLLLVPDHAAPSTALAYDDTNPADDGTSTFATTAFDWPTTSYGQTAVVGMTAVDEVGNESALSNLVCVYHTPCGGDHDAGGACEPSGGCSVTHGRPSGSLAPVALLGLLGYEIARRWKRLSSSRS